MLPNQFRGLQTQFSNFRDKFESHQITSKVVCIIPNCLHSNNTKPESSGRLYHPFSYNYLLQTYMRSHLRKDHPTIIPSESHLKPVSISCFFFRQFNCVEFKKSGSQNLCIDHKTGTQMEFDEFIYINFTKESSQFGPPEAFIEAADKVMNHKSQF